MKKLIAVVGVVALSFGVMSCKKECVCNLDGVDFPTTGTIDDKAACDKIAEVANLAQALLGDDAPKVTCEWK